MPIVRSIHLRMARMAVQTTSLQSATPWRDQPRLIRAIAHTGCHGKQSISVSRLTRAGAAFGCSKFRLIALKSGALSHNNRPRVQTLWGRGASHLMMKLHVVAISLVHSATRRNFNQRLNLLSKNSPEVLKLSTIRDVLLFHCHRHILLRLCEDWETKGRTLRHAKYLWRSR